MNGLHGWIIFERDGWIAGWSEYDFRSCRVGSVGLGRIGRVVSGRVKWDQVGHVVSGSERGRWSKCLTPLSPRIRLPVPLPSVGRDRDPSPSLLPPLEPCPSFVWHPLSRRPLTLKNDTSFYISRFASLSKTNGDGGMCVGLARPSSR